MRCALLVVVVVVVAAVPAAAASQLRGGPHSYASLAHTSGGEHRSSANNEADIIVDVNAKRAHWTAKPVPSALPALPPRGGARRRAPFAAAAASASQGALRGGGGTTATQRDVSSALRGLLAVGGGTLCHMVLGTLYCWGNFIAYAPTRLQYFAPEDAAVAPGATPGPPDALNVIPLTIVFQVCGMPIGAFLASRFSTRVASLVGGLMLALGVFVASYATTLKQFMLFYCVLYGLGIGIGYTSPMRAGWSWFPRRRGLVNGVVLLGFGCGGFVCNLLGSALANPEGLSPDVATGTYAPDVYANFPSMLRSLAAIYAAATLIGGSLVVSKPPPPPVSGTSIAADELACEAEEDEAAAVAERTAKRKAVVVPVGVDAVVPPTRSSNGGPLGLLLGLVARVASVLPLGGRRRRAQQRQTPGETVSPQIDVPAATETKRRPIALVPSTQQPHEKAPARLFYKTSTFYALYAAVVLAASSGLTSASLYKLYASASPLISGAGDSFLARAGAFGALANGLGRLFWAACADQLGFKRPFFALLCVEAVATALFPMAASTLGPSAYLVAVCLSFFCLGGVFSMAPTCTVAAFGEKDAPAVYSLVFTAFAVASLGGVQLARLLVPALGWTFVFRVFALGAALASLTLPLIDVR